MYAGAPYASLAYGQAPAFVAPASPTSGRVLLLSPRDSDAATLSSPNVVSGLPLTNLQNVQPAKKCRWSSATPQYIDIDFGTPVAPNAMAWVGHNLTQAGMVRAQFATTQAGVTAAPAVDTGWVSAWPAANKPLVRNWPAFTSLTTWSNDSAFRYGRAWMADGGSVLSYIEAGRLMVGRYWQPSINFDLAGTPLGFDPADVQAKTPYGRQFTDRRTASPPRLFEIAFYALNKREALDGIYEIQRESGMWGDVVCALDPGESTDFHRFTMQGAFTAGGAYTLPPAFDGNGTMFGAGIKLREFI